MEEVEQVSREIALMSKNWWLVWIDEHRHCIEANSVSDAVFAALRSEEYNRSCPSILGYIRYERVEKPKGMSKAAFKREWNKK
jgi:hypothetical protein